MTIYISLLFALVGVLMYALCSNPKLQEIGRITFFCGLLSFLMKISEASVNLLGK